MSPSPVTWPAPPIWRGAVRIEPLTRELVDLDTSAYANSPDAIRRHSAGAWATDGFTATRNLELIAGHEAEHRAGQAFAYSLLNEARDVEIGCAYLRPLDAFLQRTGTRLVGWPEEDAAIVTFWLIDDAKSRPDAVTVVAELVSWIAASGAARAIFRCLPEENESIFALESQGFGEVEAVGQKSAYVWFLQGDVERMTGIEPA